MRLFDSLEIEPKKIAYQQLQKQAVEVIREICMSLQISLPAMHAALWVFHCNAIIMGFQKFDRYIYACGAVLVGTKLMECLRYPTQILSTCRKLLRKRKGLQADEDSEQFLKREVKNVFEAQVSILLNIGFDFDIELAINEAEQYKFFQNTSIDELPKKFKQTLTSLYCSDVVVFYNAETIAFLAFLIIIKAENRNIDSIELDENTKARLLNETVQIAYKQYFLKYECV